MTSVLLVTWDLDSFISSALRRPVTFLKLKQSLIAADKPPQLCSSSVRVEDSLANLSNTLKSLGLALSLITYLKILFMKKETFKDHTLSF